MVSGNGKGRNGKGNADAEDHDDRAGQGKTTAHDYAHPDGFVPTLRSLRSGADGSSSKSAAQWSGGDDHLPKRIILERRPSLHHKGRSSYKIQAPGTPFDELDLSEVDFLRHDLADFQLEPIKRGLTRYRRLFFFVGILLGGLLAWAIASRQQVEFHMQHLMSTVEDQISGLGIDFSSLDLKLSMPNELSDLGDKLFTGPREWLKTKDFTVGRRLAAQGYKAEHPVILLPGIISTGLESWTTNEEASGYFRKRLWGTTTMMRTIVFEKDTWVKHLALDPYTGLDPPGIKVRAAEGFDAASYFVSGYWIWSKIIENLAVIGYDSNNLWLASYDWRLSMNNLQVRDRFFSRLKRKFEENLEVQGKKTVLVAHSMGSTVFLYFLKWVEAEGPGFGNGGPDWSEKHVEAFTSIAGTFLGVPKAMAALLSGEMRDTVELPPPAAYVLERFFSRQERARLFRTWAGSACMLIKGGEAVWGNATSAPDDEDGSQHSHGQIYSFRPRPKLSDSPHDSGADSFDGRNLTASEAQTWLLQHTSSAFQQMVQMNYSNGMEYDEQKIKENDQDPAKWTNPLEVALPNAPSMKIYCLYGAGKTTERSYWYERGPYEKDEMVIEGQGATCVGCPTPEEKWNFNNDSDIDTGVTKISQLDFPTGRKSWIDSSVVDEKAVPKIRSGCKMGEGDGTVSLLSLGAMCAEGWKRKRYNPANIKVITHEFKHEPEAMDLRGGTTTGDHVDILGAWGVNDNVLRVAAGAGHEIENHFVSSLPEYAKKIYWDHPPPGHKQQMLVN